MMRRISKMDYYAGAFITSLLGSAKGAPALFDETNDSRRLSIATNMGNFNIYIKYAGDSRIATIKGRRKTSWVVNFTDTDIRKLEIEFIQEASKNYIALVLSNRSLSDTKIAMIEHKDAMKCLEKSTPGGNRRINVIRYGSEHNFTCYGATERESDGFLVSVNFMNYFDSEASEEDEIE